MSSAKLLIGKTNLLNLHRLQRHNLTLLMLPSLMVCNQSGPTFYASQIGIACMNATDLLSPIEDTLTSQIIPAFSGQSPPGHIMRELFSLPPRLGGLGIKNPALIASEAHTTSKLICEPLQSCLLEQDEYDPKVSVTQRNIKKDKSSQRRKDLEDQAEILKANLSPTLTRLVDLAQEKGASTWLTALPLEAHYFLLHKSAFKDALALRYGWPLQNTPTTCGCGQPFNIEHVLSCPTGGFPSIRHNEIRDLTAQLLTDVCHSVSTEPHLQPIQGERMHHRSANTNNQARLDVAMLGFWGSRFEKAFLDIRVFNPSAKSNRSSSLKATYRKHEQEKKRKYEERIREVEHASFTPLVMSCTGGMGRIATTFFKRLAALLSDKKDIPYSHMLYLVRCKLSFALLRSSILCIRGARSRPTCPASDPLAVQLVESHISM